ncbi:MAG: DNA-binding response regulator [Actinomyces sp.]|nr:MAG: DNA-binding response regulator [Actinomyces sp.]
MTIRVFLLDDHELVREGLRSILEREDDIEIVGEAGGAIEGFRRIEATRPDVALIDLMLPDGDGLDVCRGVRERCPEVACLILTSYSNDDVLLSAIRADAAGFLLKRTAARELVRSLRVVANGGSLIDPTLTGRLLERLRTGRVDDDDGALEGLSPQERRLLDHLAEGLTNRQIAQRMNLAEKTVKNYVSNLLRKLNMSSRTEAAVFMANLKAERERRNHLFDSAAH